MGITNVSCGLSGLPIRKGDRCVIIPIRKHKSVEENANAEFVCEARPIGFEHEIFEPCLLPIHGVFDGESGLVNVDHDDNVTFLEERFSIPIDQIIYIFTDMRLDRTQMAKSRPDVPELYEMGACLILEQVYNTFLKEYSINTVMAEQMPVKEEYLSEWGFENEGSNPLFTKEVAGISVLVSLEHKRLNGQKFTDVGSFMELYGFNDIDIRHWLATSKKARREAFAAGLERFITTRESKYPSVSVSAWKILADFAPALRNFTGLLDIYGNGFRNGRCIDEYLEAEQFFLSSIKCRMVWMPAYFYIDTDTSFIDEDLNNIRQLILAERKLNKR